MMGNYNQPLCLLYLLSYELENYFSKYISASAIGKYLTCPLDFYYRYLAEFGEEDSVEEELETSSMGRFIHNTLEKLFTPFVEVDKRGEPVSPAPPAISAQDVENMLLIGLNSIVKK